MSAVTPGVAVGPPPYPVAVDARYQATPNRWLWLVKWLLAVPHAVALAFVAAAAVVLTIVAFAAILVTGRYPRWIFDFNVGMLRWVWRVVYYVTPVGSDRYPAFGFAARPDDPVVLDVPYPERLHRGRTLVKWLFAIPQVAVADALSSLACLLGLIGGVVLLFTGRVPEDMWRLVAGAYRWNFRVATYVLLLRDEYPPFRLEP